MSKTERLIQAKTENGKLVVDKDLFKQTVFELTEGKSIPVDLIFRRNTDSKTVRQNAYFHVIVDFFHRHLISEGFDSVPFVTIDGEIKNTPCTFDYVKAYLKMELGVKKLENGEWISVHIATATKSQISCMIEATKVYLKETHNLEVPPKP